MGVGRDAWTSMAGVMVAATGTGGVSIEWTGVRCGVAPDRLDGIEGPDSEVVGKYADPMTSSANVLVERVCVWGCDGRVDGVGAAVVEDSMSPS